MKKLLATLLILVACIHVNAQESRQIRISTDRTDLILEVAPDGRLYQSYLGDRLLNEQDLKNLSGSSRGWEVYPGSGGEDYFEPAVAIYEQRWQSQHDPALCIFGTESSGRWNRNHHPDER